MFCKMVFTSRKEKTGTVPVYLNVYDLTSMNGYAYWLGLGIYHSGVQVHGVEYAFGAHEHLTTGIFEVEPKKCPGFTFRKSIFIGRTNLSPKELHAFMEKLAEDYCGSTYHLITKNCNHFCDDVCLKLTGKPIPSWINRLARLGFLCNCVLPATLNETKIRRVRSEDRICHGEKKKLRSQSTKFTSSSNLPPTLISCPKISTGKSSRQRCLLPPSASLIHSSSTSSLSLKL